ncbi:ArnT family glycosyltransferase [uncultured Fibrella sp.]|uniref:ArnT family glycosyltransferase n=1 Tax=uncultured Fibrella sp. TaxID=1284596 RepID=UPI0035CBF2BB
MHTSPPAFVTSIYNFVKNNAHTIALSFSVLCVVILLVIKTAFSVSRHPDLSGSERSSTYGVQIVADRMPLFAEPDQPPYFIAQYSPAYYYLVGIPYRLLGWDPAEIYRIQFLSRMVSFGLVLLAMGIAFYTARRVLGVSTTFSLLMVCSLFALLQQWLLTNSRVDSLLFFSTVCFVYAGLRAAKEPTDWNRYVVLAGVFAVFAFFSKQSGLIHSIVILGFLIYQRRWSALVRLVPIMASVFVVLMMLFSGGQPRLFFLNLFGSIAVPVMPSWFYYNTFKHMIPAFSLMLITSLLIAISWFVRATDNRKVFLGISTLLFFGFSFGTTFKYGAGIGYFHEFGYVSHLAIAWFFYEYLMAQQVRRFSYYLFPALIMVGMLYVTSQQIETYAKTNFSKLDNDYVEQKHVQAYIQPRITRQDKALVIMGAHERGWMLQQLLFRHQLAYQDDVVRLLYEAKTFDYSSFNALVARGDVKYIILPEPGPLHFNAFDYDFDPAKYTLEKVIDGYQIYRLKTS